MKLALIGFGNAGGKVADELVRFQQATDRRLYRFVLALTSSHG
jgi:hypothetical protein